MDHENIGEAIYILNKKLKVSNLMLKGNTKNAHTQKTLQICIMLKNAYPIRITFPDQSTNFLHFLLNLHFSELIDVDIDDAKEAVFAQIISRLESVR